jgi:tetratricopeptide (TPR) repeat protein
MTDDTEAPKSDESFEKHPLYQAAMKRLAQGDIEEGIAKLKRLVELYPEDQDLRDLAVRWQLMVMFAGNDTAPIERRAPTPFLRNVLLILLAVTLVVVGIAIFAAAWDRYVIPPREEQKRQMAIESLRQRGQEQLEAGDSIGAEESFQSLLNLVPGDATAQAGIELSQEQAELDRLYADALTYEQQGNYQSALDRLHQIETRSPGFHDVEPRITSLEKKQALETGWLEAQADIEAGDWQAASSLLAQIRTQDPDFRRSQVEDQLFQAYTQLARQQIAQANGDPNVLRQALSYMDRALALRPANQDLLRERSLAQGFVLGAEAYARGDWAGAVSYWEPVQAAQPDYQGGILEAPLQQAYPKAAEQLIDQAYGSTALLRQAIGYLDHALAKQPGDQGLIESRRLATEYVAGADAAAMEHWNEAIAHWSTIFAVQPNYQHGVLEDRLRQACASSSTANAALCPP